jgi:hypothetical protein
VHGTKQVALGINQTQEYRAFELNRKIVLDLPERAFYYSNERRAPVKLIYAIAFAVSFVAAPVGAAFLNCFTAA